MGFFDDVLQGAGNLEGGYLSNIYGPLMKAGASSDQNALKRDIPGVDPSTQRLMGEQEGRSNQDEGAFKDELTQGTDQSGQLRAAQEQAGHGASSLGGNQSVLGSALGERSKRNYDQNQSQINRQAQLQAPLNRFNERGTQASNANEYYKIQAGAYNRQNEAYNNMVAARGQIINGVFGGVGNFLGGIMGGGGNKNKSQPTTQFNGEDNSGGIGSTKGNYGSQ